MSTRIEALTARLDLLNELADLKPAIKASREERDKQVNFSKWANPASPKFQAHYRKSTTPLLDGTFPPAAFYLRKEGRTSVKSLADIMSLPQAAASKQREALKTITDLTKALESYKAREAQVEAALASPPEILTAADLALNADELQALLRTEAPDTDARYDDSPSARLATAEATETDAIAKAESLSF